MPFLTLRINKIKIIDNREPVGSGEVKILSFITSEDAPLPMLDSYFTVNDPIAKAQILLAAAQQVLSSKTLMQIDNIKDGHEIIFGDTGYALWTTREVVESFNWQMVVMEIDEDIREIGQTISGYINDPEFETFLMNIAKLASFAANPSVTLGIAVGKYVIQRVADELLKNRDDQIGIVYQSFYRSLDFPSLDRRAFNIPDMSGNCLIDYRIFGED